MSQHTPTQIDNPTPWTVKHDGNYLHILDAHNDGVITDWDISSDTSVGIRCDAEAEYDKFQRIVRAVNAYQDNLAVIRAQHDAIDILFAMLIERDENFRPTQSGAPWLASILGSLAIKQAERKNDSQNPR